MTLCPRSDLLRQMHNEYAAIHDGICPSLAHTASSCEECSEALAEIRELVEACGLREAALGCDELTCWAKDDG